MRIWKDKPKKFTRCMLVSGIAFGLLHAVNAIATGDIFAALVQVIYTAAIGVFDGCNFSPDAQYLGSNSSCTH